MSKQPFVLSEVWPRQRANAKKRVSPEEAAYRARVRANKTRAATQASNERISEHRSTVQRTMREANRRVIDANVTLIDEALRGEYSRSLDERRAERDRRWKARIAAAFKRSRRDGLAAKRAYQKALATPGWANKGAMLNQHQEARRLTRETGIQHHVDHVVPLISPLVCGLNWEGNLEVTSRGANCRKGSRSWPGKP